jgi:ABC-type transporter Mla maintaining outer membrane lipid asymmetry ATPase subunit MlaF
MIELRNLALAAPDGARLLQGLDRTLARGQNLLVTGPSGGGKTRLLRVIAGTERPLLGTVSVGGRQIWPGEGTLALLGHLRVGFAFGSGGLLSNLSLRENTALPLRFLGLPPATIRERVEAALARLGLLPVAELRPHAVSGSARRHGNLARILALEPELILLDDPLEGLDTADRAVALEVIQGWVRDPQKTLLLAQEEPGALGDLIPDHLHLCAALSPQESP